MPETLNLPLQIFQFALNLPLQSFQFALNQPLQSFQFAVTMKTKGRKKQTQMSFRNIAKECARMKKKTNIETNDKGKNISSEPGNSCRMEFQ